MSNRIKCESNKNSLQQPKCSIKAEESMYSILQVYYLVLVQPCFLPYFTKNQHMPQKIKKITISFLYTSVMVTSSLCSMLFGMPRKNTCKKITQKTITNLYLVMLEVHIHQIISKTKMVFVYTSRVILRVKLIKRISMHSMAMQRLYNSKFLRANSNNTPRNFLDR